MIYSGNLSCPPYITQALSQHLKMCYQEASGATRCCTLRVAEMEREASRGRHAVQREVRQILAPDVQDAVRRRRIRFGTGFKRVLSWLLGL